MMRNLSSLVIILLGSSVASAQSGGKLMPANLPVEQAIDHYLDAKLNEAKLTPAPLADDAAILRRLTLDLNGRVPTLSELEQYLASSDQAKKAKLVDRLMA